MYANLAVKIGDYETMYACEVRIEGGELIVVEDLQDGSGSYAEPGKEHRVRVADLPPGTTRITADF